MQKIAQLKSKKIVVLGVGLTGLSCVRFLQKNNISCSVNDSRENPTNVDEFYANYPKVKLYTGEWSAELIRSAEVLLVSPGINLNEESIRVNIASNCEVIGDIELYCQLTNTPTLAVTGSNGKSTVVSLLEYLGNQLGYKTQLGGNIGVPVLDTLDESIEKAFEEGTAKSSDYLVLELSSFQLETLRSMKADAASVLNVSDDHLDRHKTIENYTAIKQRIYSQSKVAVVNRDDSATHISINKVSNQISFGSDKPEEGNFGIKSINNVPYLMYGSKQLIALSLLPLAGMHNALNYLAALALGINVGWSLPLMVKNLVGFKGLAHRCQRIDSQDYVNWINDSKATNVGATLAAIKGFSSFISKEQRLILIAGGDGKGADFEPLRTAIEQNVSLLYTLGKDGEEIANLSPNSIQVSSIEEAVHLASIVAEKGDTVLLSPACASIDMFKNFAERGQAFAQAVHSVQVAC